MFFEENHIPMDRNNSIPPLPDILPVTPGPPIPDPSDPAHFSSDFEVPIPGDPDRRMLANAYFLRLRGGCYLAQITSTIDPLVVMDGTIRVVHHSGTSRAVSGDFYHREVLFPHNLHGTFLPPILFPGPSPAHGIPIFPRKQYAGYMRVIHVHEQSAATQGFSLCFEVHKFNRVKIEWDKIEFFTVFMQQATAPTGYPFGSDYFVGDIKKGLGNIVGKLSMGWISRFYRKAKVEIDRVSLSKSPLNNGAGENWKTVFRRAGWDVTAVESDTNVAEYSGSSWNYSELHEGMIASRDSADLDNEWRYHVLCVRDIDETDRGVMYDMGSFDSNKVPREGAAIASDWTYPQNIKWGSCQGFKFGDIPAPYFRTAVHEIGHAMLLTDESDLTKNEIMSTTDIIAKNSLNSVPFPENIELIFSEKHKHYLNHFPDMAVRPGGCVPYTNYNIYSGIPITPQDKTSSVADMELKVSPVLEAVPLGAPVRINYTLINSSKVSIPVPKSMSMKSGAVSGAAIDPSGIARAYSTMILLLDSNEQDTIAPGDQISHSATLLRGPDGSLFPTSGIHSIVVRVFWKINGILVYAEGKTNIMVTPLQDEKHSLAAYKILTTPDLLVTLVIGGDHIKDGIEAIQTALNNQVLRPHYSFIEAKRLAHRHYKRGPDIKAALKLIDDETIMSPAELKRAIKMLKDKGNDKETKIKIDEMIKVKAKVLGITGEIMDLLKQDKKG